MRIWIGDGRDEILAPSGDNDAFRVISHDGSDDGAVLWSVPHRDFHGDDCDWGDVDDDGYQEVILLNSDRSLNAYNHDGTEFWTAANFGDHLQVTTLTRNENDDGWYLYVAEKFDPTIYKLDATDGSLIWQRPIGDDERTNARIGATDLDDDGNEELVLRHRGRIHVYDHEGELLTTGDHCDQGAGVISSYNGNVVGATSDSFDEDLIYSVYEHTITRYECID